MSFSPFARARNFTLEVLKQFLAMYPDLLYDTDWHAMRGELEAGMRGYTKTYYQLACQLGLEDRSNEQKFRFQQYLLSFDDANLKRYLVFWFKTYFAPNPFVKSGDGDPATLLYCAYAERVLAAEGHEIDFAAAHEELCGDGKSSDIEYNCFKNFGAPLVCREAEDGRPMLAVEEEQVEEMRQEVAFILREFPIDDTINRGTFFDRFSYRRFAAFWRTEAGQAATAVHETAAAYSTAAARREQFRQWLKHSSYTVSDKDAVREQVHTYSDRTIDSYLSAVGQLPVDGAVVNGFADTDIAALEGRLDSLDKPHRNALEAYLLLLRHELPQYAGAAVAEDAEAAPPQKGQAAGVAEPPVPPVETTAERLPLPFNRILFGAPGTGKSFQLKQDQQAYFPDEAQFERVTFHPAYSYAQFFGTYKPVSEGEDLFYRFVPGPLLHMLLRALLHPDRNYLLIIEEINRADVAAVFGDVFQLLDRDAEGRSEYDIDIPEDLRRYLHDHHEKVNGQDTYVYHGLLQGALAAGKLYLPANLYLWATMNSADQGVMPLDTAFKRRWQFTYIGVDDKQEEADFGPFALADGGYKWLEARARVNRRLKAVGDITEDRLLGPFFLRAANAVDPQNPDDPAKFIELFKSKVLMYLYQDVAKYAGGEIFDQQYATYSELCAAFDARGMAIFPAGQED